MQFPNLFPFCLHLMHADMISSIKKQRRENGLSRECMTSRASQDGSPPCKLPVDVNLHGSKQVQWVGQNIRDQQLSMISHLPYGKTLAELIRKSTN